MNDLKKSNNVVLSLT